MTTLVSTNQKTSEDLEMERIYQLRQDLERKRNIAESSRQIALAPKVVKTVQGKHTTKPKEFHFATDERVKDAKGDNYDQNTGDFIHSLRALSEKQVRRPYQCKPRDVVKLRSKPI